MYPLTYFELFPAFPREPRAFVAISFADQFQARWERVLAPALGRLSHRGEHVQPFRVDLSAASDAILTEILKAIADSMVIVVDITALSEQEGKPIRNANVMYEVGLAHAVRPPEEVVLFRSDDMRLDFDIAGVRVHEYHPDEDPEAAQEIVIRTVLESLSAREARRRASVRAAAGQLTTPAVFLLLDVSHRGNFLHPVNRTMGQALASIERSEAIALLLRVGAIRSDILQLTPQVLDRITSGQDEPPLVTYSLTPFGNELVTYLAVEMGRSDPELAARIESFLRENDGDAAKPNKGNNILDTPKSSP